MLPSNKYDIHPFGPLLVEFDMPESLTDWLLEEANKVRGKEELSANKDLAGQLKGQYYFSDEVREEFFRKVNPVFSQYKNFKQRKITI